MIEIILKSILLGIALSMDACAVSMANGLKENNMKIKKVVLIALLFAFFQGVMPFIGYLVGSATLTKISFIIPWTALILLGIIGVKMIYEGVQFKKEFKHDDIEELTTSVIFLQAFATSIDALTVGFTISNYGFMEALLCVLIISLITFIICFIGVKIGEKCGIELGDKAQILGGVILIFIGLEIFIGAFI